MEMTDEKIVQGIMGVSSNREQVLHYLYMQSGWKAIVLDFINKNKGNEFDGEDVFQEALIAFDRAIRTGKFRGESSLKTYFFNIAKFQWFKQLKKRHPQEELTFQEHPDKVDSPEVVIIAEEKRLFFDKMLALLGEACQKVMQLYQLNYSMEEMAQELGLKNAAMAKKKKYRCLERLNEFLDQNPDWKYLIK